jgi:pimeloyl-ACP methyl ester carboxylesterase
VPTSTTTTDGVEIAYDVVGVGDDLVFVHGITDERHDWAPVVDRLAGDHRCTTLDLRGHGESGDTGDYSALAMAGDVIAVLGAAGIDDPILIGHSLGGFVVSAVASIRTVRGVINVDQPLRMSDFKAALEPLTPMLRGTEEEFHAAISMIFSVLNGDRLDAATTARLAEHEANARQDVVLGVWSLVLDTPAAEIDAIVAATLPAISAPYLTILGNDVGDDYAPWLAGLLPQVQIEKWENYGHFLHLVDPDRFAQRVNDFVASV